MGGNDNSIGRDLNAARLQPEPFPPAAGVAFEQEHPFDTDIYDQYVECYTDAAGSYDDRSCTREKNPTLWSHLTPETFEPAWLDWAFATLAAKKNSYTGAELQKIVDRVIVTARAANRTTEAAQAFAGAARRRDNGWGKFVIPALVELTSDTPSAALLTIELLGDDVSQDTRDDVFRALKAAASTQDPNKAGGAIGILTRALLLSDEVRAQAEGLLTDSAHPAVVAGGLKDIPADAPETVRLAVLCIRGRHEPSLAWLNEVAPFLGQESTSGIRAFDILLQSRISVATLRQFLAVQRPPEDASAGRVRVRVGYRLGREGEPEGAIILLRLQKTAVPETAALAGQALDSLFKKSEFLTDVLASAEDAFFNKDAQKIQDCMDLLQAAVAGGATITSKDLAGISLLMGMRALTENDDTALAIGCFASAQEADGDYWVEDYGEHYRQIYQGASERATAASLTLKEPLPAGYSVLIDMSSATLPAPVMPGAHFLQIRDAGGRELMRRLEYLGTGVMVLDWRAPAENASAQEPPRSTVSAPYLPTPDVAVGSSFGDDASRRRLVPSDNTYRIAMIGLGAISALALGASVFFFVKEAQADEGIPAAQDLNDLETAYHDREFYQRLQWVAGGALGVGLTGMGVGFTLNLNARRRAAAVAVDGEGRQP